MIKLRRQKEEQRKIEKERTGRKIKKEQKEGRDGKTNINKINWYAAGRTLFL